MSLARAGGEGALLFDGTGHGKSDAPFASANSCGGAQSTAEVNGQQRRVCGGQG